MSNQELSDLLKNIASAYEIKNKKKNFFKTVAYERAATSIEHLSSDAKDLWDEEKLSEIGGIGDSIASHIGEIFEKGESKHFKEVMKGIPPAVFELIKISGIGPKTAMKLSTKLGIKNKSGAYKKLAEAIKKGKIAKIEGFGEKSEGFIEQSLKEEKRKTGKKRMLLPYAMNLSGEIIEWMLKCKDVKKAEALGSLRRRVSTIGDLDIAVASNNPKKILEHFVSFEKTKRVIEKGDKTASIILPNGVQIDAMVQKPEVFGSVMQHFTGSKGHNIKLREYANKNGVSLSEYGMRILDKKKAGKLRLRSKRYDSKRERYEFSQEKDFYDALALEYIPPELREEEGEIETALKNKLPKLIELPQVKADLQIHSDFDIETSHDLGMSSAKDIIKKADSLGYEYIAFTEHNPSQRGHDEKEMYSILKSKAKFVEELNYSFVKSKNKSVKKVFNSLEIDILPDGSLPLSVKDLETLDFALVSIHSNFRGSKEKNTKRVLKALNNPRIKIFAHPTGRIIQKREGIELDWEKIFDLCLERNIWVEINASPPRLDLPDFLVRQAIKRGVKMTLGTDAHHVDHMDNMIWGVTVARRGWAEKKDIINSLDLIDFKKELAR